MTKTFTENDLVRFLYNDLTPREKNDLQYQLLKNGALRRRLLELEEITEGLNKVAFKAPRRAVEKIMAYSKGFEVGDFQH
ncbi:MAG: hypothetical protein AAGA85_27875 [Bacteroidota bacterium]